MRDYEPTRRMLPYGYRREHWPVLRGDEVAGTRAAARKRARVAGVCEIEAEDWHPDLEDWSIDRDEAMGEWDDVPSAPLPQPVYHTIAFKLRAA